MTIPPHIGLPAVHEVAALLAIGHDFGLLVIALNLST